VRRSSVLVVAVLSFSYFLSLPLAIGRADESHLLFEARRVLDGQVIYRDFFESLTPLSFYLFAAIYRIAGTTLLAARVGIALIETLGCILLFHLVRRVAGSIEAALATMIFAGLCIPTWPYASPHWISTTLGLLVAATVLAERWQDSSRVRPLVAGVLIGCAICVQQQRGVFLALWFPLAVVTLNASRSAGWKKLAPAIAWGAGGATFIVLVVLGHAAWRASLATLVDMLFGFAVKSYGPAQSGRHPWAAVLPLTWEHLHVTWLWLLRAAPLFVVGEGIVLIREAWRGWERRDRQRAALCLLALLMGLSIWYLPDFLHVSFVLPVLLIPGATLLHRLRTAAFWSRAPVRRQALTLLIGLSFLAVGGQAIWNVALLRSAAPLQLETAFGAIRVSAEKQRLYEAVRGQLLPESDGRNVIYSYPNDAWLYLALPADNATPFSFLAPNMFPAKHFQQTAEILRERRPGIVVALALLLSGKDGTTIGSAIDEGYHVVEKVDGFQIYARNLSGSARHVE
jgi:hypothetical protein